MMYNAPSFSPKVIKRSTLQKFQMAKKNFPRKLNITGFSGVTAIASTYHAFKYGPERTSETQQREK
eukprot:6279630-Amphidinium_carterae.1